MDKCPLCKGDLKKGDTTYSVDLGFGIVVVRNVPAKVCGQCGEEWIESKVAEELEKIVNTAREHRFEIEVISFQSVFTV